MTVLLGLDGLTKAYPGVVANDGVSFEIGVGEIHALLGENGAGKSTLVKMVYGLVKPDSGQMEFNGAAFSPTEPRAARAAGVAMVFQHFSLFEALTVAENISLGMEHPPRARVLAKRISEMSAKYGLTIDPDRIVGDLSAGERQRVEIIRCLLQNPRLLIMDEPTSVLTPQEVTVLFETLRKLKAEGTSILYISHKLEEIRSLCERATVLRGGKVVATCVPAKETAKSMAEMMVGSTLSVTKKKANRAGDEMLAVTDFSLASSDPFGTSLKDVGFSLAAGKILGVGGVAGNGQDELMLALSGEVRSAPETITFRGKKIGHMGIRSRRVAGILSAPEERLGHAAAPEMSLAENALMTGFHRLRLGRNGFIKNFAVNTFAEAIVKDFDVRTAGIGSTAKSLSGGNLQKFVVGREVLQRPDVLIVNQPTWGVDAAAATAIRQALLELVEKGSAVLVISQDLDELFEISDDIAVLFEGRLSAPRKAADLTMESIGLMMGGQEVAA